MKLYVAAPVAERAWILPTWWECLRQQTRQPDGYVFVYSHSEDETLQALHDYAPRDADLRVYHTKRPYIPRTERMTDPKDRNRAEHFSRLRNLLRRELANTEADLILSLDTDILLEDPTIIQRLEDELLGPKTDRPERDSRWDVLCPITYLHPMGAESRCYNGGHLGGGLGPTQVWQRLEYAEVLTRMSPFPIDVPCAIFLATRRTMGLCRYQYHECGEDIGFGQSLKDHGMRVGYVTDIEARHVWDQGFLVKEEKHAA